MKHFNVKTRNEVLSLLDEYKEKARIVAGGTDILRLMRKEVIAPTVLVNIKTIPDLAYIREDTEGLKAGVLTSISEIGRSAVVRSKYKMLAEAADLIASPQIRNMATIGGDLLQDVDCWYYRRPPITGRSFFCHRKGGTTCYAVAGDNRYHSIIGRKGCSAVCPSDMALVLVALDAKIKIMGPNGERVIKVEEFYTPQGNILKPNELITEIQVPTIKPSTKQRYLKFRVRKAIDHAISSVAAAITTEAGVVTNARIVLGGVAPMPYRAFETEEAIIGKGITESVVEMSAKVAVSEAVPLSMNTYKLPITETLIKRAILD